MNAWNIFGFWLVPILCAFAGAGFYMLFCFLEEKHAPVITRHASAGQYSNAQVSVATDTVVPAFIDILVVDDSAVARSKLAKLLETDGYTVRLANDGDEALVLLNEQRFHVLITDLEMPNMNGFELIAAVQGGMATEDLPIIAVTGHEEMQARVHDCQGLYGIFKKTME